MGFRSKCSKKQEFQKFFVHFAVIEKSQYIFKIYFSRLICKEKSFTVLVCLNPIFSYLTTDDNKIVRCKITDFTPHYIIFVKKQPYQWALWRMR